MPPSEAPQDVHLAPVDLVSGTWINAMSHFDLEANEDDVVIVRLSHAANVTPMDTGNFKNDRGARTAQGQGDHVRESPVSLPRTRQAHGYVVVEPGSVRADVRVQPGHHNPRPPRPYLSPGSPGIPVGPEPAEGEKEPATPEGETLEAPPSESTEAGQEDAPPASRAGGSPRSVESKRPSRSDAGPWPRRAWLRGETMKEAILNVTETEYLLFSKKQDRLVWTTHPAQLLDDLRKVLSKEEVDQVAEGCKQHEGCSIQPHRSAGHVSRGTVGRRSPGPAEACAT